MKHVAEVLKAIEAHKHSMEFMPTGFPKLDDFLDGGMMRKELVVIGGHTGIGKSAIAGQILYNIATQGYKSAYFSLEISNELVVSRLLGSLANIKPTRIYAGLLEPEEYDRKIAAKAKLMELEGLTSFYDECYELAELEKAIRAEKPDFVIVDFIQNVVVKGMDEYTRLTHVSLQLQRLAKEMNCCILVLSQLSNRVAASGSAVVEYKGSGAIAMVCDLGFFIERQDPSVDGVNRVRLTLKKNRRGISGIAVELLFENPGGRLTSA